MALSVPVSPLVPTGLRWDRDPRNRRLAGVAVAGLAVTLWAGLLVMVSTREGIAEGDSPVLNWVLAHRTASWTTIMSSISSPWTTTLGLLAALIGVGAVAAIAATWRPLALVGGAVASSAVVSLAVKTLVHRPRPATTTMLGLPETGWAFPSGHTLVTTVLTGALALLVWQSSQRRAARVGALVLAVVVSLSMGASRLYLGYHWTTDVLASYALATAILATFTLIATGTHTGGQRPPSTLRATGR